MSDIASLRTYAVIPAAGCGQRFSASSAQPKQYALVCGEPLIYHTITAFLRIQWIDKIIVVADHENRALMQQIADSTDHRSRVRITLGSTTRHRSIAKGIDLIAGCGPAPDIVVIHDGARPLVDEQDLKQLVCFAADFGASGLICKLTSTVLMVSDDHFLDRALDRNKLFASETPQAFKYQYIKEAYNRCSTNDYEFNTECLDLVQRYTNSKVKLIEVNASQYFKVTFKKDVFGAEALIKEQKSILIGTDCQTDTRLLTDLMGRLSNSFREILLLDNSNPQFSSSDSSLVLISISFCKSFEDIFAKNQPKCHSLIRVIIDCNRINESHSNDIKIWAQNQSNVAKNFFAIHTNNEELIRTTDRIIDTIIFLAKHSPQQMNGFVFYM